jgi:hypothetical protein
LQPNSNTSQIVLPSLKASSTSHTKIDWNELAFPDIRNATWISPTVCRAAWQHRLGYSEGRRIHHNRNHLRVDIGQYISSIHFLAPLIYSQSICYQHWRYINSHFRLMSRWRVQQCLKIRGLPESQLATWLRWSGNMRWIVLLNLETTMKRRIR